jgi:hypothetical protein
MPEEFRLITPPKESEWKCYLLGDDYGVVFRPKAGDEPNFFHRWVHRLVFGFRWVKS